MPTRDEIQKTCENVKMTFWKLSVPRKHRKSLKKKMVISQLKVNFHCLFSPYIAGSERIPAFLCEEL